MSKKTTNNPLAPENFGLVRPKQANPAQITPEEMLAGYIRDNLVDGRVYYDAGEQNLAAIAGKSWTWLEETMTKAGWRRVADSRSEGWWEPAPLPKP